MAAKPCRGVEEEGTGYCQLCPMPMKHPCHSQAGATPAATPTPVRVVDHGDSALEHASPEWKSRAVRAVRQLADAGKRFTSEDVTDIAGLPAGHELENGNNAVGKLMREARHKGVIVRVEGYEATSKHGSKIAVWVGPQAAHLYNRPDYHRGETA